MGTRYGTNAGDSMNYTSVNEALTIFAYGGDDEVYGTDYGDYIVGGSGNDELWGLNGNDWIWGESGDDLLVGGNGDDRLIGGAGNDRLNGQLGDDWLWGEDGNDELEGGGGDDRVFGGAGDDVIYGDHYYKPYIYGDDVLDGGDGNDVILGGWGNDTLAGGHGDDTLNGGSGNDVLVGGRGHDTMSGGLGGIDRYEFNAADVVTRTVDYGFFRYSYDAYETDTILDFVSGNDLLDVGSLLAGKTSFAGTTAADAIGQGYLYWAQHGQPGQVGFGTTVYIDRDGSPFDFLNAPDLAVVDLKGVEASQLSAAHFLV